MLLVEETWAIPSYCLVRRDDRAGSDNDVTIANSLLKMWPNCSNWEGHNSHLQKQINYERAKFCKMLVKIRSETFVSPFAVRMYRQQVFRMIIRLVVWSCLPYAIL
jgi:hypothetical protein